jgi:hypothetical protein
LSEQRLPGGEESHVRTSTQFGEDFVPASWPSSASSYSLGLLELSDVSDNLDEEKLKDFERHAQQRTENLVEC